MATELVNEPVSQRWTCDPLIEKCATEASMARDKEDPLDSAAFIIVSMAVIFDFLTPLIWYFVRMNWREKTTGTSSATNGVDIATNILWIVNMIFFMFPFVLWPFHYLGNEKIDFMLAYSFVSIYADGIAAITLIFWFFYLFVAIYSGSEDETICQEVNSVQVCYLNTAFVTNVDGWLTWTFYTLLGALQYFVFFWYGADAVRYLRPNGGYDLYFLYPTFIYDLLVVTGAAPNASRQLTGAKEVFGKKDEFFGVDETATIEGDDTASGEDTLAGDDTQADADTQGGSFLADI